MYFSSRVHLVKAKKWRKRAQRIRKKGKRKKEEEGEKREEKEEEVGKEVRGNRRVGGASVVRCQGEG